MCLYVLRYLWKGQQEAKGIGHRLPLRWGADKRLNFSLYYLYPLLLSLCWVAKSYLTLETTWTIACQATLSMGFPRQEYYSELPFPSPGDLPSLHFSSIKISISKDVLKDCKKEKARKWSS